MVTESNRIRYTLRMPALSDLAQQYGINPNRSFFPVNSLRLFYFLISDFYTNGDVDAREKIGSLIPKIEAVLAARSQHRKSVPEANAQTDWGAIQQPLQDVYAVIGTPKVQQVFEEYFGYTIFMQDDCFLHLYSMIYDNQKMDLHLLNLLLRTRSMDSILFSTVIAEIIALKTGQIANPDLAKMSVLLHYHIQLGYQLNDLVDAIVFAKDDLEAKNFSPFEVIRRIAPEPQAAKELIGQLFEEYKTKMTLFPTATNLQTHMLAFYNELIGAVA
jgi:hypothetical protein